MLSAQELKDQLTEENVKEVLSALGAEITREDNNCWVSNTICHHGNKNKLYYYKPSKIFTCFTECGTMDIIDLVKHSKDYENITEAINYICNVTGISQRKIGVFGSSKIIDDWEFISKIRKRNSQEQKLKVYDESVLKTFLPMYPQSWVDEGISIESMKKYGIMYSVLMQKIIIPHRDVDNNLIGIRTRATIPEDEERYGKYNPYIIGNQEYTHSLAKNLYGLNINKAAISRIKKIMLVEAEKSVMQADTMFGENNFTVALCGCNLSKTQRDLILDTDAREVIIALDKQWEIEDSPEYDKWLKHVKNNIVDKLSPYINVSVIWDLEGLLGYKDSPTDRGKEVLLELMKSKMEVLTNG